MRVGWLPPQTTYLLTACLLFCPKGYVGDCMQCLWIIISPIYVCVPVRLDDADCAAGSLCWVDDHVNINLVKQQSKQDTKQRAAALQLGQFRVPLLACRLPWLHRKLAYILLSILHALLHRHMCSHWRRATGACRQVEQYESAGTAQHAYITVHT